MWYIFFSGVLFVYLFACCLTGVIISAKHIARDGRGGNFPLNIVNIIVLSIFGLPAFGFSIFIWILFSTHVMLIFTNQTTAEYLKHFSKDHPKNPFRGKVMQNIKKFCTSRKKKSHMNYSVYIATLPEIELKRLGSDKTRSTYEAIEI